MTYRFSNTLAKRCAVLVLLSAILQLSITTCNNDENECRDFSAANGDFDSCQWLLSEADDLCAWKGYDAGAFGEIETFSLCDTTNDPYIVALTCCK